MLRTRGIPLCLLLWALLCLAEPGRAIAQATGKTAAELGAALRSDDLATRRQAALELDNATDALRRESLPALIASLESEKDGQVRLSVVDCLTRLGPAAAPAARALVESMPRIQNGNPREEHHQVFRTALALVAIGEPAVGDLRTLLTHKQNNLRADAAMALGRIGPPAAPAVPELAHLLSDPQPRIRREAALALGRIGQPSLEPLIAASTHETPSMRSDALAGLGPLVDSFDSARDAVLARTSDPEPTVRAAAVSALARPGQTGTTGLADILIRCMCDSDESVRQAAVSILVDPSRRELLRSCAPGLEPLLHEPEPGVVRGAAFALHALGAETALPVLLKALNECPTGSVEPIAQAIVLLGPAVGPQMCEHMNDSSPNVRAASALALGQIRPVAAGAIARLTGALDDAEPAVQLAALSALGSLGPRAREAAPAVQACLKRAALPSTRVRSISVLAHIAPRDEGLVAALVDCLNDASPEVRLHAIKTLGALGPLGRTAIPNVLATLQDPEGATRTRVAASEFLSAQGAASAEAVPTLVKLLDQDDLRAAALRSLAALGRASQPAFERLVALLGNPDPAVRAAALTTLGSLDLDAARLRPHLAPGLMDEDSSVRAAASQAIQRLGPRARIFVPDMILAAQKLENREAVSRMLRRYERNGPDPESVPELVAHLEHANEVVRQLAAQWLGQAGKAATDSMSKLEHLSTNDPNPAVRQQAQAALEHIRSASGPPNS